MYKFLATAIFVGLLNASVLFAQTRYQLVIGRPVDGLFVNSITLKCRILSDSTFDPNATYWLDGTAEVNGEIFEGSFGDVGIRFTLTRDTEGVYTCGRREGNTVTMSTNSVTLVVHPTNSETLNSRTTFYSSINSNVTLNCLIEPGQHRESYSCDWIKNGTVVAQFSQSTQSPQMSPRYVIDPDTFSLTILNVVVDDESTFTCIVRVNVDGNTQRTLTYQQTEDTYLTLNVNAPPVITRAPMPQTVSTSVQDPATFTCVATGLPPPIITWTHKEVEISSTNDSQYGTYTFTSRTSRPNDGRFDVSSTLTIKTFEPTDTGNVTCNAATTSSADPPQQAPTTLVVLGNPIDPDVRITKGRSVLFLLTFATVIPSGVVMQLNISYMDLETMITTSSVRPERFVNTNRICLLDERETIPTRFHAWVNVIANIASDPVSGPTINFTEREYNRDQPTGFDFEDSAKIAGLAASFAIAILITIFLGTGIIIYRALKLRHKERNKERKAQKEEREEKREERREERIEEERIRNENAEREKEENLIKYSRELASSLCEQWKSDPKRFVAVYEYCYRKIYNTEKKPKSDGPESDGDETGDEDEGFIDIVGTMQTVIIDGMKKLKNEDWTVTHL